MSVRFDHIRTSRSGSLYDNWRSSTAVDQAEDGRVRTDAEGQGKHYDGGKATILYQQTNRKSNVLKECVHDAYPRPAHASIQPTSTLRWPIAVFPSSIYSAR